MKKRNPKLQFRTITSTDWNKDRLNGLLGSLRGRRILVVGDVGVDRYTVGTVERISPEAPVPVVLVHEEKHKLGLAANVAENIRALGGIPLLFGVIGKDRAGEDLIRLLEEAGIESSFLAQDVSRRTSLKERIVSERQQLVRVDYESQHGVSPEIETQMIRQMKKVVDSVDGIILEDYAKGLISSKLTRALSSLATKHKIVLAIDPNSRTPVNCYRGCTVLTPNTKEAEQLSGLRIRDLESLAAVGSAILAKTQARNVIITRGKDGMALFEQGKQKVQLIPTNAREVYDVSGAGDTVIAMLSLCLASGGTLEDAAILGNIAAGVEVGKSGTATVSSGEIQMMLG